MTDAEVAQTYVRYFLEGAESDSWASEDLSQLAVDDPEREWRIVLLINATPVEGDAWRAQVHAALGCGAIEDLVALHERTMLPVILRTAVNDAVLRAELSTIYESSISAEAWSQIQLLLTTQGATANAAKPGRGLDK